MIYIMDTLMYMYSMMVTVIYVMDTLIYIRPIDNQNDVLKSLIYMVDTSPDWGQN